MAETINSQLIRDAMRELEAILRPQIQAMFVEQNAKIDKQNAKINKSIADLFEALRLHTAASSENVFDKSSGAATSRKSYSGDTRLATLGFPRFNGDNMKEWLCQIEQFFTVNHTPEELKSVAQLKSGDTILQNWPAYKELLRQRFGEVFDEPIAELKALQETDGIVDYHNKFELIRVRSSLPEDYLVSAYLEGLSVDTQKHAQMFQPKSIHHCLLIGLLYKTAHPKKTSYNNWQFIQSTSSASQAKILLPLSKEIEPGKDQESTSKEIVTPRKILTAEQMNERPAQRFGYCRDKNDDLDDTEPDTTLIEREPHISTNIMKVGFEGNKLLEPVETLTASWTMVSEFNASKTQLTRIPESIGRLSYLVRLDLHQNRISTLPASIKGCSSIIELYIGSNCLSALPPELGDSSHLGTHDLHSNQLKEYPVETCKLKLTVLDLSYNSFSNLSAEMGLMNTLRGPVLIANPMRTIRNTLWVKGIHSKRLKVHINHLHQLLSYMGVLL